jgi:hypothetical protein
METAADPMPTIPRASRGAGPAPARVPAGAQQGAAAAERAEAGGGFAAELRRAAEEPAQGDDRPADAALPRPDPSTAGPAAPPPPLPGASY